MSTENWSPSDEGELTPRTARVHQATVQQYEKNSYDTDSDEKDSSDEEEMEVKKMMEMLARKLDKIKRKKKERKNVSKNIQALDQLRNDFEKTFGDNQRAIGVVSVRTKSLQEQIDEHIKIAMDSLRTFQKAKNTVRDLLRPLNDRIARDPAESIIDKIHTKIMPSCKRRKVSENYGND